MRTRSDVYALAAKQGGVVTRRQLAERGFSFSAIQRKVTSGQWQVVSHGSYRLFDMTSRKDTLLAAVAVLPRAVASHFSAATIHRMPSVPTSIVSVTVHASTTHSFDGVKVVRCRDLEDVDVTERHGIPVTTPARTIFDLASQLTGRHTAVVADDAVAARLVTWDAIADVTERVGRRGKPGSASMRRLLEERLGNSRSASVLETRGVALLSDHRFPGFVVEYPLPWSPGRRFDVAFPSEQLAVEWDSRRWHSQMAAFQSDRDRDRDAAAHGWQVVRFTWDDVTGRPDTVVQTLRAALDHRGQERTGS